MDRPLGLAERILKHDRAVVYAALFLVIVLAWIYTFAGVGMSMNAFEMTRMPDILFKDYQALLPATQWTINNFFIMLTMWWLMMVAMMLPSATPVILLACALNRRSDSSRLPYGKTFYFVSGYLLIWFIFSLIAVIAHWQLEQMGILTSMMQNSSKTMAAGLLIAAGIWQFTPIKQACLKYCRSPVIFLTQYRRPGNKGALLMGMHHGVFCLGCCWFLMCLIFVICIMNVYWLIGLTVFVLIEKTFAHGPLFGQIAGLGFILSGAVLLIF